MKKLFKSIAICSWVCSATPATCQSNSSQLKVGVIIPLTSVVAQWGERVKIGLETANELHGNKLSFQFEDEGACDAKKALSAYRKLVDIDKVSIIFVSCLSGTEAIAPVAARDSVLLLSLGLLNDSALAAGAKLVDLATEIEAEAGQLVDYLLEENPKKIGGIFYADAFGQEFAREMSEALKEKGHSFANVEEADGDIQSFKSLILRWKQNSVDLLVTTLADRQQITLLREMRELGFQPKIYSTYALESYAPSGKTRELFEGIKYTHPYNSAEKNPETIRVVDALQKKEGPGQTTNINSLFAYDGIGFLLQGLEKCEPDDSDCLFSFYTNLGKQAGVSGEMEFAKSGALARPYRLKIVRSGNLEWLP